MKSTLLLALIILAALPAAAQKMATPNCSANAEAASALAQDYAARVDGLLRNAHASLRIISERVEAGSMSPERAEKLKLAVTRDMISRLDTLSAVYNVRPTHNGNATVSVEELKSEGAFRLEAARRGQSAGGSNDSY